MDIKAKAEELIKTISGDTKLLESFKTNPVAVVEKLLGVDLPDDQINKIVELVKTKLDLDKAADLLGSLSGLFKN